MGKRDKQRDSRDDTQFVASESVVVQRNLTALLVAGADDGLGSSDNRFNTPVASVRAVLHDASELVEGAPEPEGPVSARSRALTVSDRATVIAIAEMLRAAVLRKSGDEADRIADRVVEKLREMPTPITEPEALFISVKEAARILGITRAALDKRIQRRQVPGVRRTAGRRVQIDRAQFLAGLAKRGR